MPIMPGKPLHVVPSVCTAIDHAIFETLYHDIMTSFVFLLEGIFKWLAKPSGVFVGPPCRIQFPIDAYQILVHSEFFHISKYDTMLKQLNITVPLVIKVQAFVRADCAQLRLKLSGLLLKKVERYYYYSFSVSSFLFHQMRSLDCLLLPLFVAVC